MRLELVGRYSPALMDELLAAFPELRGDPAPPEAGLPADALVNPRLSVFQTKDGVVLEWPEGIGEQAVMQVVDAHDPDKVTTGELTRRDRLLALARVKANPLFGDLVKVLGL